MGVKVTEQTAKKAFNDAFIEEPKRLIGKDTDGSKRFITKTRGYFDIQAYVLTGLDLPKTNQEFSQKYPRETFDVLKEVKSGLYDETMGVVVDVSTSCNEFDNTTMRRLWSSPRIAVEYADQVVQQLKDNKHNFLKYWKDLIDPKYAKKADWDDTFKSALRRARVNLKNIHSTAGEKKKEMEGLVNEVVKFRQQTTKLEGRVKEIGVSYSTTPVHKGDKKFDNLIAYLVSDKAAASVEMIALQKQMEADLKDEKEMVEPKWDWLFIPFCGVVGLGTKAYEFRERLQKDTAAYSKALEQYTKDNERVSHITRLINVVKSLSFQFKALDEKMESAINAMNEVVMLFNSQMASYSSLITYFELIETGLANDDFDMRAINTEDGINDAVECFGTIKKLAQEFQATSLINPVGYEKPRINRKIYNGNEGRA